MITLRLDKELENSINHIAKHMGVSKSELVRKSVIEFIKKADKPTAWELGNELFGKCASGKSNLSEDRKEIVKKKIKAKK